MNTVPVWAYDPCGYQCPLKSLGCRMGYLAMRSLGVVQEEDRELLAFPEIGVDHPYACLVDGIQAATGCPYGRLRPEQSWLGKLAVILFKPGKGAVRVAAKPAALDGLARFEFLRRREAGQEPPEIPDAVTAEVVEWLFAQPDEVLFAVGAKPGFRFQPLRGSFHRARCAKCHEYVFEDSIYLLEGGRPHCYPCAGYEY